MRIQKPFNFVPILGIGQITIRGSSTMRIENFLDDGDPLDYRRPGVGDDVGTCT